MNNKYTFRGFLIALCMAFYDWRYLWIGNLSERMWVIHNMTNYIKVNAPILKAAKHCATWWGGLIFYDQLPDTLESTEKSSHYYEV